MTIVHQTSGDEHDDQSPRKPRRFFASRFGLRSLLIFAFLFCVLLAWIGRGFYRVRQEDAAIETILRSGGSIYADAEGGINRQSHGLSEPSALPPFRRAGDVLLRSVGWRKRPAIATVKLAVFADDPVAYEATGALAFLPETRTVSLFGSAYDDASLRDLDQLPRLEALYLLETGITARGFSKMAAPERIRFLRVEHMAPDASVLAGAGTLRGLRRAEVVGVVIKQADVAVLASLPELEELKLEEVELIGDHVLTPLSGAKTLRSLEVTLAAQLVRDPDDLRAIAEAPNLERLRIDIDDDDLPLLDGASHLRFLATELGISEEAGTAFSVAHPECLVQVRASRKGSDYLLNGERTDGPAYTPTY